MIKVLRVVFISIVVFLIVYGTRLLTMKGFDDGQLVVPNMTMEVPSNILVGLDNEGTLPIIENSIIELEHYPIFTDGTVYLPVQFVKQYFNDEFYWDEVEKVLTFTTVNDVIRMRTDDLTYFVNDEPLSLSIPIRELKEGVPYMPLDLVEKFSHHKFYYDHILDTLVIEDLSIDGIYGRVQPTSNSYGIIRTWKDQMSPVVKKVADGEEVKIYGEDSIWIEVRTAEGLSGYIRKSEMGDRTYVAGQEPKRELYDYSTRMTFEGGLNLAWHQVSNVTANSYLEDKLEGVHNLDVISPTWFHIKDTEGNVSSIADLNYVKKAHEKGIQVWALFSNQFSKSLTHEVLSSTRKRENLIKELLALSVIYELDGINVDFENVGQEDGEYFVQFMKELTPYLKNQGLVVSVDMYVPSAWTAHYGRDEVGEVVDYVMIMAYDEHWSTSPESGSVASIDFVERGILKTLEEVPKEKTVLGLPYYTRLWKEEDVDGTINVSSKAYSMEKAYSILLEAKAELVWLDNIKQYYGEYREDDIVYKMWLEEERSIEEKVKLMEKYELAGVAGWKIGLEKEEIWDVLEAYLLEE